MTKIEKTTQITFTESQYKLLIKLLSMGEAVYGVTGDMLIGDESSRMKETSKDAVKIINHILCNASEVNFSDNVYMFQGKPTLNDKYMMNLMSDMELYDDFVVFDGISNRLALRDLYEKYTPSELKKILEDDEKRIDTILDLEEKYRIELDNYEYSRIRIVE